MIGYSPVKKKALRIMREEGIEFTAALKKAMEPDVDEDEPDPPPPRKKQKYETLKEQRLRLLREAKAEVDRIAPE